MVLTKRQKEIFDYIEGYLAKEGVAPSYDEIASQFQFRSKGTVYRHIHTLEKKGLIFINKNKSRSIRLNTKESPLFELPVVGSISRREGIKRYKIPDYITVPSHFDCHSEDEIYLVNDSGFREEYILKRDLLIITSKIDKDKPQTCLIQVDKRDFSVKKVLNENDIIKMFSVNTDLMPLFYEPNRIRIIGRLVGIIREF